MDAEIDFNAVDMLCCYCGTEKVYGAKFERCVASSTARGFSREEAELYCRCELYSECPTPENHKKDMIPLEELEHGAYYLGCCRNAGIARWNAEMQHFVYMRQKFGEVYADEIRYWVEALPGQHKFDEYKPYCKVENAPFEIPMVAYIRDSKAK